MTSPQFLRTSWQVGPQGRSVCWSERSYQTICSQRQTELPLSVLRAATLVASRPPTKFCLLNVPSLPTPQTEDRDSTHGPLRDKLHPNHSAWYNLCGICSLSNCYGLLGSRTFMGWRDRKTNMEKHSTVCLSTGSANSINCVESI